MAGWTRIKLEMKAKIHIGSAFEARRTAPGEVAAGAAARGPQERVARLRTPSRMA